MYIQDCRATNLERDLLRVRFLEDDLDRRVYRLLDFSCERSEERSRSLRLKYNV